MRKKVVAVLFALLTLGFVGPAVADDEDYAAYPPGNEDHCQELGDENAGDNDNNGLAIADAATAVIETLDGECDNSNNSRRPD